MTMKFLLIFFAKGFRGVEWNPLKEVVRRSVESVVSPGPLNIENKPPLVPPLVQGPCLMFKSLYNLSGDSRAHSKLEGSFGAHSIF